MVHASSMCRCHGSAVALLLAVLATSSMLPSAQAAVATPQRLQVGLVLSGGGAKGTAHVGVIKVLERLGYRRAPEQEPLVSHTLMDVLPTCGFHLVIIPSL